MNIEIVLSCVFRLVIFVRERYGRIYTPHYRRREKTNEQKLCQYSRNGHLVYCLAAKFQVPTLKIRVRMTPRITFWENSA